MKFPRVLLLTFCVVVLAASTALASDLAGLVAQVDVFKGASPAQARTIAAKCKSFQAAKDQHLIKKDTQAKALFMLQSGQGKVRFKGKIVDTFGPGRVTGEMGFVGGGKAQADVFMSQAGVVATISWPDLRALLDADPKLGYLVMENIARKIAGYSR